MIPRFSNPHLLPSSTEHTSRSQLFEAQVAGNETYDVQLAATLKDLLVRSLGNWDLEYDGLPRRKRRRIATGNAVEIEAIPFRLLSSSLPPRPLVLDPKPPPPSKVREPQCEDNDIQAEQRAKRAEAAAVDFSWIFSESKKTYAPFPSATHKVVNVQAPLPAHPPAMMIFKKTQPLRATRPPVHPSQLSDPKYSSESSLALTISAPLDKLPSVQINIGPFVDNSIVKRRRRHKRRERNDHFQPTFWRPDASWRGKCLGYAYGYPSSWATDVPYRRDPMRNAVHDNLQDNVVD